MIDSEVERLRRLRALALRVRAVARRLGEKPATLDDRLLTSSACAAWRVARIVSGHLRAHPYARFQKDAGVGTLLMNGLTAQVAALGVSSRGQAMVQFEGHLKALSRELDDARSLTRISELSDSFGRAQAEMRALVDAVEREANGVAPRASQRLLPQSSAASRLPTRINVRDPGLPVGTGAMTAGGDWPYLGL